MNTTHLLVAIFSAAAGFAAGYLYARFLSPRRGTEGIPDADTVDCFAGEIKGHLDPANCDEPEEYRAKIYSCMSTIENPLMVPVATNHATAPNFHLKNVPRESGATGCCLVVIWVKYGGTIKPAVQEVFHCGGGSGSGSVAAAGGGGGATAPLFRIAPRQYRLTLGQMLEGDPAWLREAGTGGQVVLAHAAGGRDGDRSCCWEATTPSGVACRLVVAASCCSDRASGELTLAVPENGEPAQQVVFQCESWDFTGHNRLTPSRPASAAGLPGALTISPA